MCGEVQTTFKNEHDSFFDIDVNYDASTLCPREDPLSVGERELVEGFQNSSKKTQYLKIKAFDRRWFAWRTYNEADGDNDFGIAVIKNSD